VQLVDMVIMDGTDIYQHTTSAEGGIRKLIQLFAKGGNTIRHATCICTDGQNN